MFPSRHFTNAPWASSRSASSYHQSSPEAFRATANVQPASVSVSIPLSTPAPVVTAPVVNTTTPAVNTQELAKKLSGDIFSPACAVSPTPMLHSFAALSVSTPSAPSNSSSAASVTHAVMEPAMPMVDTCVVPKEVRNQAAIISMGWTAVMGIAKEINSSSKDDNSLLFAVDLVRAALKAEAIADECEQKCREAQSENAKSTNIVVNFPKPGI